jgi:FPC/CPF motif-containing protein YcgG
MNDELERIWKEVAVVKLTYYPGISFEDLQKESQWEQQMSAEIQTEYPAI